MSTDLTLLDDMDFLTKVDEHKKLFPLADLQGQVMKLDEELDEYLKATTMEEKIKELADCIICCIGIFRWATLVSRAYLAFIYSRINKDQYKDIINEVNNKWQILTELESIKMANIITFEKQPEKVWKYTYFIYVNGQYSGYISKCKFKGAYPFAYSSEYNISLDYGIDHKYKTFNELKKAVRQIIKEKINEGNGIQKPKR